MNEAPKTRILILGGGFASLHVAIRVDGNNLGGFYFFHHHGPNSRRYQELPIAATRSPIGRFLLLSKLEEKLIVNGNLCDVSYSRYRMITRCESAQDHRYPQLESG
jgi:Glycogen debranching enzyme N terminal